MQMLLGAAVCLMKRERKEPAATAKTSFLQDPGLDTGARRKTEPAPVGAFPFPNLSVPRYLSTIITVFAG